MNDRKLVLILFLVLGCLQLLLFGDPTIFTNNINNQLRGTGRGTKAGSHACTYSDNIAGVDFTDRMCIEPIDIVYTWVNGSDAEWAEIKNIYKKEYLERMNLKPLSSMSNRRNSSTSYPNFNNTTHFSNSTTNHTTTSKSPSPSSQTDEPSVGSDNRYRDNEELRYSLRSIFRFAPWVRKVYIVTANQVPSWINMEHPRLQMVNHDEIFPNSDDLPTFSSPAIESNLHRIPGLSKKFIYFNDDVMLGAPTWPEDFHSPSTGQKVYLSWDVPKCSEGCSDAWIGDKQCDLACNNSKCLWDLNDCENTTTISKNTGSSTSHRRRSQTFYCSSGCALNWVGDKVCDSKCENVECAWDGGDCGMKQVWDGSVFGFDVLPLLKSNGKWKDKSDNSAAITLLPSPLVNNTVEEGTFDIEAEAAALIRQIRQNNGIATTTTPPVQEPNYYPELPEPLSDTLPIPIYFVPSGTVSLYINMSSVFPSMPVGWSTISKSTHDQPNVIGNAIVLQHHKVMIILFQVDEDAKRRGRTTTNIVVHGSIKVKEIKDGNGTIVNTTSRDVSIEFEISTNAAGNDDVRMGTKSSTKTKSTMMKRKDRVTIHVRNSTTTSNTTIVTENTTDASSSTVVYLPSGLSAGIVHLNHSSSSSSSLTPTITGNKRRLLGIRSSMNSNSNVFRNHQQQYHQQPTSLPLHSHQRRRHLLDIYGDSLVNVNMMYHSRFGKMSRKVPAHMPHMIDVDVMSELWSEYPKQFSKTSGRRFRGGEDMQFSFAHFYWLIHKVPEHDLKKIWNHDLDVDGDGKLSTNELHSLAAIVEGKAPDDHAIREITKCMRPERTEDITEESDMGTIKMKRTIYPHATFGQFMNCSRAVNGVKKNWKLDTPTHTMMTLDEVTFEMIGDDYNHTKEQLDGIRAKRTKFICVNDDMHDPSKELQDMLHNFYEALFALPSPFELPKGTVNPYLKTNQMRAYYEELHHKRMLCYWILIIVAVVVLFRCRSRSGGG
jgi:UDP-N-acetylglucosamine-lysosomal-enzyme